MGDVALFAQVLSWACWPGTDPEAPEAQDERDNGIGSWGEEIDHATAKLVEAIFTVASVGRSAEVHHG
jgi:hypothetical protein